MWGVADPQKPNPNVFWCPKCRCHGEIVEKERIVSDSQGSGDSTQIIQHCIICDAKGGVPCEQKEAVWSGKVLAVIILPLAVICLLTRDSDPYSVPCFFSIVVWVATMWLALYWPYYRWKKWAKERGWEEEKPKAE